MPYVQSRHVRKEQIQHEIAKDGTVEQVLLISTNLPLSDTEENFDHGEFDSLVEAAADAMRHNHLDRVVIQGMAVMA